MLSRRRSMMNGVARRYGRLIAQHGDEATPAFYPIHIAGGIFGAPFGKVKEGIPMVCFGLLVFMPLVLYCLVDWTRYNIRINDPGLRPSFVNRISAFLDLDDPDYPIRMAEFEKEKAEGKLEVRWGGSNYLASYLWQPGDPEPDIRRKQPPPHAH